eukprot:TRINITY_DN4240_c0_g1_i4.p1 TRINITY_DN4240_c0_g1~~TRINITY_DN4240_c0_g1_i4.p1  ORF type:complete len:243 (+),score=41.45 TRINITY_DN4240_c0_g1_i4:202-930(+)
MAPTRQRTSLPPKHKKAAPKKGASSSSSSTRGKGKAQPAAKARKEIRTKQDIAREKLQAGGRAEVQSTTVRVAGHKAPTTTVKPGAVLKVTSPSSNDIACVQCKATVLSRSNFCGNCGTKRPDPPSDKASADNADDDSSDSSNSSDGSDSEVPLRPRNATSRPPVVSAKASSLQDDDDFVERQSSRAPAPNVSPSRAHTRRDNESDDDHDDSCRRNNNNTTTNENNDIHVSCYLLYMHNKIH